MLRHVAVSLLLAVTLAPAAGAQQFSGDVRMADGRLTVKAVDVSRRDLIEEVARVSGVSFTGVERLSGKCSIEFTDQPVMDGLGRLLDGVNYGVMKQDGGLRVLIHSMAAGAPAAVVREGPIIIPGLSDSPPSHANPSGAQEIEDEDEQDELAALERAAGSAGLSGIVAGLRSEFGAVRLRAIRALAARSPEVAVPLLASALADDELEVAMAAADALARIPGKIALDALGADLTAAADVDVRFAALRGLALRADPKSIPHVQKAVGDADGAIRGFAAALLQELEARQRAKAAKKQLAG